jgi:hypothetical protein
MSKKYLLQRFNKEHNTYFSNPEEIKEFSGKCRENLIIKMRKKSLLFAMASGRERNRGIVAIYFIKRIEIATRNEDELHEFKQEHKNLRTLRQYRIHVKCIETFNNDNYTQPDINSLKYRVGLCTIDNDLGDNIYDYLMG